MTTTTSNSTPEINLKKPDFRNETRLGLVLYGGVSLAVYMNGVCREFYNAMRGRGIYKLIKALTDSDIVVDIVSGTSAGGINGVLLSYAIANSYTDTLIDFEEFADIWRENGDISKLLRKVNLDKTNRDSALNGINSVLDGEGYYQKALFDAFENAKKENKDAPKDDWYSDFKELDLFITGTDVLGRIYQTFDNTGKIIDIKDHRSVFHLKYREDRDRKVDPNYSGDLLTVSKNDINTEFNDVEVTHQALAKLCRITSCFPVAFPVVTVKLDAENKISLTDSLQNEDLLIDKKLETWGTLLENRILPIKKPEDGYQLHFVDGGVLDNRPFSYTINTIYSRTTARPVNRQLFYLDPNPESFVGSSTFDEMKQPNIWEVINDSLISLPSYESIGKDLQEIKERNDKIRRYKLLRSSVSNDNTEIQGDGDEAKTRYFRTRLVALRDRVLPFFFDNKNLTTQKSLETTAELLTGLITNTEEIKGRKQKINEIVEQIDYLDSQYAFRHHNFLLAEIFSFMNSKPEDEYLHLKELANQISWLLELIKVIDEYIQKMFKSELVIQGFYKIVEPLIEKDMNEVSIDEKNRIRIESYQYLLDLFGFLLDIKNDPKLSFSTILEKFKTHLNNDAINQSENTFEYIVTPLSSNLNQKLEKINSNQEFKLIIKNKENDSEEIPLNIFKVLEDVSKDLIKNSGLSDSFDKFQEIDQIIYPYEYLADIQGKDSIEVIRISPNDADRGFGKDKGIDEKLAGDQFRAFGGFFKKSWRSNDMLWGRLDGLNRIVDGLITKDSLKNFASVVERQSKAQSLSVEAYVNQLVNESFPKLNQDKNQLIQYLERLAKNEQLSDAELQKFLETIVLLGHREILNKDLGNVFEDAIAEQLEWNQEKIQSPKNSGKLSPPEYTPITGYFDQALTPFAIQQLADVQIKNLLTDQNQIDKYFRDDYQVGSETISKNIPLLVLQDLLAQTGMVLRNIVNTPSSGNPVSKTTTFRVISSLLQLLYSLVQFQKPKNRLLPNSLQPLISLLLPLIAIISICYILTKLPVLVFALPIAMLIINFFYRVFEPAKSKSLFLWILVIIALIGLGLYFLPDGTSTISIPFVTKLNISIDNLMRK